MTASCVHNSVVPPPKPCLTSLCVVSLPADAIHRCSKVAHDEQSQSAGFLAALRQGVLSCWHVSVLHPQGITFPEEAPLPAVCMRLCAIFFTHDLSFQKHHNHLPPKKKPP